jgi:hypothetical protein
VTARVTVTVIVTVIVTVTVTHCNGTGSAIVTT